MGRSATLRAIALILSCLGAAAAGNRQALAEPLFAGAAFENGAAPRGSAVGDVNGDGRPDLVTSDYINGNIVVLVSRGDGTFEPPRISHLGVPAIDIALNDLDLDGDLDLVSTLGGGFGISLNVGDGHFPPLTNQGAPSGTFESQSLVIADFNHDDSVDVAVSETATRSVYVYLSRGGFGSWDIRKIAAGRTPQELIADDFNADGHVDLAAEGFCATGDDTCAQGEIAVLLGRGDGTFDPATLYAAGPQPRTALVAGDYNADGIVDLATVITTGISVLFGAGGGAFRAPTQFDPNALTGNLTVADFNGDGIDDIAHVGFNRFTILLGREDEILRFTPPVSTGAIPQTIDAGDFNGDGMADLVIGHRATTLDRQPGYASVYLGHGDGTFRQRALSPVAPPAVMVDADLNEDGRPDLLVSMMVTTGVSILLNQGAQDFLATDTVPAGNYPTSMVVSDFNGDGHSDVAMTNAISEDVSILIGDGAGHLAPGARPAVGKSPSSIAASDFNEDGVVDLAVTNSYFVPPATASDVSLLIGVGDGTFAPESRIAVGVGPKLVVAADFNRDGHGDLAVASYGGSSSEIELLLGRGDATFAAGTTIPIAAAPWSLVTGDLNGDTYPDLVVSTLGYGVIAAYLGKGDGDFLPAQPTPPLDEAGSLVLADFDSDGRLDLAARSLTGNSFDDKVLVLRGAGDGTFSPLSRFAVGANPRTMIARDLDGDGRPDLAVASAGQGAINNTIALLFNQHRGPDSDHDGVPDESDDCTDTDQDGLGDVGFPANTCPADNCPHAANPDQANGDHDALGDACDECTDSDHDGWGDAGYPQNRCAQDNCPAAVNPFQGDADHDGPGDACDSCNDPDGDGYGSSSRVPMTCPLDNCHNVYNPGQEDADGDGRGDVCDACPLDALDDFDGDGHCGDVDNCPALHNPSQADQDGDHRGDGCDNCPTIPNPDQADTNHDGAGDACQPSVRIYAVREDGGAELEVVATVQDPQGETLTGTIQILEAETRSIDLPDLGTSRNCGDGIFPENVPGEGIGYANGSIGVPILFNFPAGASNFGLTCYPWLFNYYFGLGTCAAAGSIGEPLFLQGLPLPASICLVKGTSGPRFDATVLGYDANHISMTFEQKMTLAFPFTGALPSDVDIQALSVGAEHRLRISATDGNTPSVSAEVPFLYQGESSMSFRRPTTIASEILISFTSGPGKGAGLLTWRTDSELNVLGFNVVTRDARGNRAPLNSVIIPCEECITGAGHAYTFVVPKHKSGRSVFVEVVYIDRSVDVYGPSRKAGSTTSASSPLFTRRTRP